MPKSPPPERLAEYDRLHKFFSEMWLYLIEQNPSLAESARLHDPRVVKWAGGPRFSEFFSGLRQGISDLLEMTKDFNKNEVSALDSRLKEAGLASLTEMRSKIWKTIPKILRRQRIRNDDEYYLLKEKVIGLGDTILDDKARRLADHLLQEYENKQKGNA